MVKMKRIIIGIIAISFAMFLLVPNLSHGENQSVFDEAYLFSGDEIQQLEQKATTLENDYNMDIVIVTTDDALGKSSREFADDYFDYGGFGTGTQRDGILFLLDMDNREAYISTSGIGIRYLTDKRIESILDDVFDGGLSDGDYFGASLGFLKGTKYYLEQGIPSDQYNEPEGRPKNKITLMDFIISLIGGSTTGGVFYAGSKSRYKTKKQYNPYSYKSNSFVEMGTRENRLIDSYVTNRIIPTSTNNNNPSSTSGRSSTHTSSSGRTHGGGGRKF